MIAFERIRYKNFLSTGNHFTEYDLNTNKKSLIVGKNGAGKTTFLDAITFALFGKSFRGTNKPNLINEHNDRNCLVELEFKIGDKEYFVRRGLKPTVFEIMMNGNLLTQDASSKDYQDYFEKNILKLNFKTFTQVVVLGTSNYVPFMRLPLASRREVVEDLLDIQIFSKMNSVLKEKMASQKSEIDSLASKISTSRSIIAAQTETYTKLVGKTNEKRETLQEEIVVNRSAIEALQNDVQRLSTEIGSLATTINLSVLQGRRTKVGELAYMAKNKISEIDKRIGFFSSTKVCSVCEQDINEDHISHIMADLKSKKADLEKNVGLAEAKKKEVQKVIDQALEINNQIQDLQTKIHTKNSQIEAKKIMIRKLESEVKSYDEDQNIEDLKLKIADLKTLVSVIETERLDKVSAYERMLYTLSILKDGGIKSKIINKYMPILNEYIKTNLAAMNFHVSFELNENFEESVRGQSKDNFLYWNFSEGEKQRIDLAILFAFRKIAAIKNSLNTNLMILDEVFDSSMDAAGTDDLMSIMTDIQNTSVFVISHRTASFEDKFDSVFTVSKTGNYSTVTKDK